MAGAVLEDLLPVDAWAQVPQRLQEGIAVRARVPLQLRAGGLAPHHLHGRVIVLHQRLLRWRGLGPAAVGGGGGGGGGAVAVVVGLGVLLLRCGRCCCCCCCC